MIPVLDSFSSYPSIIEIGGDCRISMPHPAVWADIYISERKKSIDGKELLS